MINEERVRKGIAALRSGEYPQARGALRKGDCFCTLGVFCEVYHKETGEGEWGLFNHFYACNDSSKTEMPYPVARWYGFTETDPILPGEGLLSWLNDVAGMTFPEIADKLENLFIKSEVEVCDPPF